MKKGIIILSVLLCSISLNAQHLIYGWGWNQYGELGDGTIIERHTPTQITNDTNWKFISSGYWSSAAIKFDGTLWIWGANNNGQLGDGTTTDRNIPLQMGTDNDWKLVKAGAYTMAIKENGTLWAWGWNCDGQLGDGTTWDRHKPLQIGKDKDWKDITGANATTLALKENGTIWAWGWNKYGQLGDGTTTDRHKPLQVGTDTDWKKIAGDGDGMSAAIKSDGTLWTWGHNRYGQLGDGTTTDRNIPIQMGTDTDWEEIKLGLHHTLALKTNGTLWMWGNNQYGELGDGTTTERHTPIQMGTDTDWKEIAGGNHNSLAIKTNGTLWAWGLNEFGKLGDGTKTERHKPVQIGKDSSWTTISSTYSHSIALKKKEVFIPTAYMAPDLGTPGMNTYVEFIAPVDKSGYFGSDGFYMNNPGDAVRVMPVNSADASKIEIGPCVVSWDGRMISTQIFVNSDVEPNSSNWDALTAQYKIQLKVEVNSSPLDDNYTFYLVDALDLNISGTQFDAVVKRSPRGAILCKNLTLPAKGKLTFGTDDIDPNTMGNQAFLPVYLLVKEKINGNNATISVSGGDAIGGGSGHGGHGGPGGGGGGGQWYDDKSAVNPTKSGEDGGDGFTGGGKGGTNNVYASGDGSYKNVGTGSGDNGESINGVNPAMITGNYEAAGGGTGHPFGISGENCQDGNSFDPPDNIGYGGGTGYIQRTNGAGGGYGSAGEGKIDKVKGKVHGNELIVPFAGGSGGASGNPESFSPLSDVVAGGGGGGGGAIRIFAKEIADLTVTAEGGEGENRDFEGGGGSGGAIEFDAKTLINNVSMSVLGGNQNLGYQGGEGYARIDAMNSTASVAVKGHTRKLFAGIVIDTTTIVTRGKTTSITFKTEHKNCELYRKIIGTPNWELLYTSPDNGIWTYDYPVDAAATHDYEYIVLIDRAAGTGTGSLATFSPKELMSQAAANMLMLVNPPPELSCTDEINLGDVCYNGTEIIFEIELTNVGGSDLIIDIPDDCFELGTAGFELINPIAGNEKFVISKGKTRTIKIKYIADKNNLSNIHEVFVFNHNDNTTGKPNPWKVDLRIDNIIIAAGSYVLSDTNTVFETTVEMKTSNKTVTIKNTGTWDMEIINVSNPTTGEFLLLDPRLDGTIILPGDMASFDVQFAPQMPGIYSDEIEITYLLADKCNYADTVFLSGNGIKARAINLRMPANLVLSPALDNYTIPIYIKLDAAEASFEGYNLDTIEISMNKTLFFVKKLQSNNGVATLINDQIFKGDKRIIQFSVSDISLKEQESVLVELVGATMLGDTTQTALEFERVVLDRNGEVRDTNFVDGSLTIEICEDGGERLLLNTGGKVAMKLAPNPADTYVDIIMQLIENGDYTLEIYSLDGIKQTIATWTKSESGFEEKTEHYELNVAKGVYFIKLKTPSMELIEKFMAIE